MLNSDPAAKNRKAPVLSTQRNTKNLCSVRHRLQFSTGSLKGQGRTKAPGDQTFLMWGDTVCFKCSDKKKKKKSTLKECVPEPKNQTLTVELFYSLLLLTRLTFQGCPFETKTNIGIQLTRWRSFPSKQKPCLEIEAWLNRCPEIGLVLFSVVAHDGTKVK